MKFEEGFGVELLRVEAVRLLPDLLQLSNAALKTDTQLRDGGISVASRGHTQLGTDRNVDLRVLPMFLLQLLLSLLLVLPLLLIQTLQVLTSLVLLQHLVAFELLVSLRVVVLQVFGGLDTEADGPGEGQGRGQGQRCRILPWR